MNQTFLIFDFTILMIIIIINKLNHRIIYYNDFKLRLRNVDTVIIRYYDYF